MADWALLATRTAFDASLLGLGGALVFDLVVAPRAFARMEPDEAARVGLALGRWRWGCLVIGLAGLGGWAVLQTADMAGTEGVRATLGALPVVLWRTAFGHLALLQGALLAGTGVALATGGGWAVVPALGCVVAEAGHGHGFAMGGFWGPLFELSVLHLVAAAVWVGGLPPLLMVVALARPPVGAVAARWFSPVGKWAVAGLAGSAVVQGWWLVGSVRALTGTAYGWTVTVKIGLFGVLFGLAVANRYRWAPRLRGDGAAPARRVLIGSVAVQSAAGLAAVLAACVLSGLMPGMDMGAGR